VNVEFQKGHGFSFSRAAKTHKINGASQAAEKLNLVWFCDGHRLAL